VLVAWNSPHYEDALREAARSAVTSGADRLWLVIDRVHAQTDIDPRPRGAPSLISEQYLPVPQA